MLVVGLLVVVVIRWELPAKADPTYPERHGAAHGIHMGGSADASKLFETQGGWEPYPPSGPVEPPSLNRGGAAVINWG